MAERNYDAAGEMLIMREQAKLDRAKAKAKALEKNMTETITGFLKSETVKRALARDAMAATKDSSRRDVIFDKAGDGAYDKDREVVTGREPRPWEN